MESLCATDHPCLIVVAGMRRSGSTWQFNAIRALLQAAGFIVYGQGYNRHKGVPETTADVILVKEHRYIADLEEQADAVFLSTRPIGEALDSMARMQGTEYTERDRRIQRNRWQRDIRRWLKSSKVVMCTAFDQLTAPFGPYHELTKLHDELGLNLHQTTLRVVSVALGECIMRPPTDTRKDPVSFVFRDHYTSRTFSEIRRAHTPPTFR